MPLYTADALVLRTYKLGKADRIVVFLTRDRGKKRGVAKGARRPRSRFTGALEPLTEARVAYFEKERRELVGLNYAETRRSPMAFDNQDALGYVSYFAELLDEWAQEADADDRLYRLGASMLDALATVHVRDDRCGQQFAVLHDVNATVGEAALVAQPQHVEFDVLLGVTASYEMHRNRSFSETVRLPATNACAIIWPPNVRTGLRLGCEPTNVSSSTRFRSSIASSSSKSF